jgi:isocitrate dehydrogenase
MLKYIGWQEAADIIDKAVSQAIAEGYVTYDLAEGRSDVKKVLKTSEFGKAVVDFMK